MAGEWAESQISLDIPEDEPISSSNTKSEERASLLPGDNSSADQKGSSASLLSFQFYQNLFDVDTDTVLNRIRTAAIPKKNYSFIESVLRARRRSGPDMYGPFWICVTLVFSTAICGNLSHFLALRGNPDYDYSPQFDKVSLAATTIFGYAWILPFMIYMFMNYKTSGDYQFLEIVCTYGYSLFIYVPISFFWVFPMEGLRWFLLLAGAFVSGSMLAQALWPAVRSEKKQLVYALLGLVVVSNLALAIGFKVYFFNAPVKLDTAAAITSDINPLDDTHQNVPKDIIQPVEGAAVNQSVGVVEPANYENAAPDVALVADMQNEKPAVEQPIALEPVAAVQDVPAPEVPLAVNPGPIVNAVVGANGEIQATQDAGTAEASQAKVEALLANNASPEQNPDGQVAIQPAPQEPVNLPAVPQVPAEPPISAGPSDAVADIPYPQQPQAPVEPIANFVPQNIDPVPQAQQPEPQSVPNVGLLDQFAETPVQEPIQEVPEVSAKASQDAQAALWEDYYQKHPEARPAAAQPVVAEQPVVVEQAVPVQPVALANVPTFLAVENPVAQPQQFGEQPVVPQAPVYQPVGEQAQVIPNGYMQQAAVVPQAQVVPANVYNQPVANAMPAQYPPQQQYLPQQVPVQPIAIGYQQ